MSKLRSLSTAFWSDPFIEELSPSEKLLFIYLITNEKTNMLGIYEASIKKISFETGINKPEIEKALSRLESAGKVRYVNNYIMLINYMKHQHFNTNMKKSAIEAYLNLPKELQINGINIDKNNPFEAFETLSKALGMVSKIEEEEEVEYEVEDEFKKKKKYIYAPIDFYSKEIESNKDQPLIGKYRLFWDVLNGNNKIECPLDGVLSIPEQVTFKQFTLLYQKSEKIGKKLSDILEQINNNSKYYKGKKNLSLTLHTWLKDRFNGSN